MFVWIILHYQTMDLTVRETQHILHDVEGKKQIIIVDNASPNGSGKALYTKYKSNDAVDVLLLESNLGFAQGNNEGYKYAKRYNPKFIIFTNNDIQITSTDIQEKIRADFIETKFALLGPDVYVPTTHVHQNPKQFDLNQTEIVKKSISKNQRLLNNRMRLTFHAFFKNIRWLRKAVMKTKNAHPKNNFKNGIHGEEVVLHGSFLIVSTEFMGSFSEWAFYPGTFFYYEMEILAVFLSRKHLISMYDPEIRVIHFQNMSTKARFSRNTQRLRFQAEQMVKSGKVFLKVSSQDLF